MATLDIQVMALTAPISTNVYYVGLTVMHNHYAVILMEVGPVNRAILVSDRMVTEINVMISMNVRNGLISAQMAMLIVAILMDPIHAIVILGIEILDIMVVIVTISMNVQNAVMTVKLPVNCVTIQ